MIYKSFIMLYNARRVNFYYKTCGKNFGKKLFILSHFFPKTSHENSKEIHLLQF